MTRFRSAHAPAFRRGVSASSDSETCVRRSRTAQSLYEATDIRAAGRPSVGLVPRYGYTRASAIGVDAVAALVLVEEARPTTDLGLDLPLTLEGTDR